MKDHRIERLTEDNRYLLENFTCIETDEMLYQYKAKERQKIKVIQEVENIHYEVVEELEKD